MDDDKKFTVAIELDEVIIDNTVNKNYPQFGNICNGAQHFLSAVSKFANIMIYTTRTNSSNHYNKDELKQIVEEIKDFLDDNKLYYDHIYCGIGKPDADVYIDTRSINIHPCPDIKDFFKLLQEVDNKCKR